MPHFLSVDNIFLTVLGYPMSYVEFIGTVLYLASVWLIVRRNMLTWIVGIISVLLYMVLFYQIQLYSDTLEQVYYLGVSLYGWWHWSRIRADEPEAVQVPVRYSTPRTILLILSVTLLLSLLTGMLMTRIHEIIPSIFTVPADYPYLDALTTVMSFVAMALMAQKRVESWYYWITVDVIGIGLYFAKDVRFISLLYVILLVMAVHGLFTWHRNRQPSMMDAVPQIV